MKGSTAMLLLIRVRYPALANILGLVSALAFIAYGVAAHHRAVAIMSAASVALTLFQLHHGPRTRKAAR
jgi:hypothetical protein